jgi:hypothetical protein
MSTDTSLNTLVAEFAELGVTLDQNLVSALLTFCNNDIEQTRKLILEQLSPEITQTYFQNKGTSQFSEFFQSLTTLINLTRIKKQ